MPRTAACTPIWKSGKGDRLLPLPIRIHENAGHSSDLVSAMISSVVILTDAKPRSFADFRMPAFSSFRCTKKINRCCGGYPQFLVNVLRDYDLTFCGYSHDLTSGCVLPVIVIP
jgi:hypothetical protein